MVKTVVPTGGAGPVTVPVGDGVDAVVVVVANMVVDDWADTSVVVVDGIVVMSADDVVGTVVVVLLALDRSDPQRTSAMTLNIAMACMLLL